MSNEPTNLDELLNDADFSNFFGDAGVFSTVAAPAPEPTPVPAVPEPEEKKPEPVVEEPKKTEPEPEVKVNAGTIMTVTETPDEGIEEETNEKPQAVEAPAPEPEKKHKRHRRTKEQIAAEAAAASATTQVSSATETAPAPTPAPAATNTVSPAPQTVTMEINTNQSCKDIINALNLLPAVDPNFEAVKKDINDKMDAIVIQNGMDRPNIEMMMCKIDELSNILNRYVAAANTAYENIASEKDGILYRVVAKGSVSNTPFEGSNEAIRKANGIVAAEQFTMPHSKEKVNLFWAVYSTRYAKNFFNAAINQVESKRRLLKVQSDFLTSRV